MGIREIMQQIGFADKYISPITNIFVDKFSAVIGTIDKIGTMETRRSIVTNSGSMVNGNISSSRSFGATRISSSTSSEQISRTINFLKIGSKALTDVSIPNSGFFEAIDLGDKVGVILSNSEKQMYYIHNLNDSIEIGEKPFCIANVFKWIFLVTFVLLAFVFLQDLYTGIRHLKFPDLGMLVWVIPFFILYRSSYLGSIMSAENWEQSVIFIKQNNI